MPGKKIILGVKSKNSFGNSEKNAMYKKFYFFIGKLSKKLFWGDFWHRVKLLNEKRIFSFYNYLLSFRNANVNKRLDTFLLRISWWHIEVSWKFRNSESSWKAIWFFKKKIYKLPSFWLKNWCIFYVYQVGYRSWFYIFSNRFAVKVLIFVRLVIIDFVVNFSLLCKVANKLSRKIITFSWDWK